MIPVDGTVESAEAMVNISSLSGESEPIKRSPGQSVYAGTVVEEGSLAIRVTALNEDTRIHKIADMIDESENLKAGIQNKAEKMADALVPFNFMLAGTIFLVTRNPVRASSALVVDYSCAIKLTTPLAFPAAMREGANRKILIKGGKFLEAVATSDTIVFDKTGTLTTASRKVAKVVPFNGYSHNFVLRTAACFEEHFPHSIARAVVKQSDEEGLLHQEEHSEVKYIMAHGIASRLHGKKILIGSAHFVLDNEKVPCLPQHQAIIDTESERYSVLYLAYEQELIGIFCIEDPLRREAPEVLRRLRDEGFKNMLMLTGDNERAASKIAAEVGIENVRSQLLPEDKTQIIKELKEKGTVIMVGDGVNDSPSLSAADAGISMNSGADIAREVADIVLTDNRLEGIVDARRLSKGFMRKISINYAFIVSANTALLLLGLTGVLTAAASAFVHNLVTVAAGVYSVTPILTKKNNDDV